MNPQKVRCRKLGLQLAQSNADQREEMLTVVGAIERADYEDDRAALQRLFAQLAPYTAEPRLASYAHYWRGFAMWRRTINGFNDSIDLRELAKDLSIAVSKFQQAEKLDPNFVDAAIGEAGCEMNLIYIHQADPEERRKHILAAQQLAKRIQAAAPDNPRFLWLLGGSLWVRPTEAGGSHAKALEAYHHGLAVLESTAPTAMGSLEPQWGEPELLMSLAWSSLNASNPNPAAAERYARSALEVVPNWYYVRDILLPQIEQKNAQNSDTSKEKISVTNPVLQFQMLSNDPDATAKFYAALFDWSADAKNEMGYRRLHTGSHEGIQGGIWPAPPGAPAFIQLFVGVTDLKAALERAEVLGAKVLVPPTRLPEGGQVAILQDPQGMSFGLWQRAG